VYVRETAEQGWFDMLLRRIEIFLHRKFHLRWGGAGGRYRNRSQKYRCEWQFWRSIDQLPGSIQHL
jgi:hypothetical protein